MEMIPFFPRNKINEKFLTKENKKSNKKKERNNCLSINSRKTLFSSEKEFNISMQKFKNDKEKGLNSNEEKTKEEKIRKIKEEKIRKRLEEKLKEDQRKKTEENEKNSKEKDEKSSDELSENSKGETKFDSEQNQNEIFTEKKYKIILPNKSDKFLNEFFAQLNLARYDPEFFSRKYCKLLDIIKLDAEKKYFLPMKNFEIILLKGIDPIIECLEFLKNNNLKHLKNFEIVEDLKVPFFSNSNENKFDMDEFNSKYVEKLRKKFETKYKIFDFISVQCLNEPYYGFLLSIINGSVKGKILRQNFFSEELDFIGVSHLEINERICKINITFASKV